MSSSGAQRRNTLATAVIVALMQGTFTASAQDTPQQAAPAATSQATDASTLDTVTVTGSRIKRAAVEGPAPVTVITGEQMKKEGFATVYDALQTLTEAIGPVQNDYDWGQSSVNASPLNLRNLGPGRSLLLINGHRVADYPMPYQGKSNFANYNNIPTGIVERIEVLSGAASAIYGSDAMGGVVNVVLKSSMEDQVFRAKYGTATRGGRTNWDVSLSGGFSSERGSIVYNVQHFDRGELLAKDRPFMDEEADAPYDSLGVAERHFGVGRVNPYPGLYLQDRDRVVPIGPTSRASFRIAPPSGACDQYGDLYFLEPLRGYDRNTRQEYQAGSYCAQRVFNNWALRTGSEDNSAYFYGTWDFTEDLQGWFTYGAWKSTGRFNSFLDGFSSGDYWDPNANDGAGGSRAFLKFQSPQEMGGQENILTRSDETALDFNAGLRGRFGERWDWEAMLGRATYEVLESFPTLNQGAMRDFYLGPQLGTRTGVPNPSNGSVRDLPIYAPDYDRLWNPVDTNDIRHFSARGRKLARSYLNQAQFVLSGDLFEGWAGPIGFAGVLEAGRQGYKLTPDPKILNQDEDGWYTPFGNVEQGGGDRNRYAAGVEFRVPLHNTLNANIAGRYDKYDAVSSDAATTYQLGLEWRPIETLLVRGTYGTSFRAPDMHFVYAKPSSGIADQTDYVRCYEAGRPGNRCDRNEFLADNVTVARNGSPDLKYEEGKSYSYGFVWDAFDGFSLSADYWFVSIDNLIDDIGDDQILLDDAYCRFGVNPDGSTRASAPSAAYCDEIASRVTRDPVSGDITQILTNPINRAQTEVDGVDVNARYALAGTRTGDWRFNLNYTNMLSFKSRGFPTDPFEDKRKEQNPRTKITLSANWTWEKWNATLMMYQKSGGRSVRWGGCAPFDDGYVPSAGVGCLDDSDPASPTFGQSTHVVTERRTPRRYFNGSVGYAFTDDFKVNLYVSNLFDKLYSDRYHGDFAFSYDDPVGREVAAEVVYRF